MSSRVPEAPVLGLALVSTFIIDLADGTGYILFNMQTIPSWEEKIRIKNDLGKLEK